MLLYYSNYFSNSKVCFYSSDMKLYVYSDAAYLVAPKAKSRITGFFYCSNGSPTPPLNAPHMLNVRSFNMLLLQPLKLKPQDFFQLPNDSLLKTHVSSVGSPTRYNTNQNRQQNSCTICYGHD